VPPEIELAEWFRDFQPSADLVGRAREVVAEIEAVTALAPVPDNIYLITDGLPTRDASQPRQGTADGSRRLKLFTEAARALPPGIPVNVILLHLEGDPMAASSFWKLAADTGGSFISPSKDWP
jgi:hypothetical protein